MGNNYLGLLKNIPNELLGKINVSNSFSTDEVQNEIEVTIITGEDIDKVKAFVNSLGGKFEDLGYNFAIITIPTNKLIELASSPLIQYLELPKIFYFTDNKSNTSSCVPQAESVYGLDGEGILVGFIDSGIDFTHPAFKNDDGTTRIEYIYDLNDGGAIYNKEKINEALKSNDPYFVVNSYDVTGHGTHVAGIACGGGIINKDYYGVATKSSIAMIKVARSKYAISTFIMKGLKFLVDKSKELNMPLVVNMSLSTNDGAHNGSSLLEQYISIISNTERVSIAIAAGNEADVAHHVSGSIEDVNEIYFNVGSDESTIAINLYKTILPQVAIEIISPTGVSSGDIYLEQGYRIGYIGESIYELYDTGPKPFDLNGEVGLLLRGREDYVEDGQWKIVLRSLNDYKGNYNIWLPVAEGLNTTTKFLNPTIYNTLGIPATVRSIISVGSYNYLTNNISSFSGRGSNYDRDYVKPDIVAPGENIYAATPNKSIDKKTGTSMATPHVAGICALMMQWGIIKNNDPYLYGQRLKYYLIIGAKKGRKDIIYPDPAWGYGQVCAYESIKAVSNKLRIIDDKKIKENDKKANKPEENYYEYNIGKVYIRKPKDI